MAEFQLPISIDITNPIPVDKKYGPYSTVAAAKTAIPIAVRFDGLTVMITGSGEYWWRASDLTDTGLIQKTPDLSGYIPFSYNGSTGISLTTTESVFLRSQITGAFGHVSALNVGASGISGAGLGVTFSSTDSSTPITLNALAGLRSTGKKIVFNTGGGATSGTLSGIEIIENSATTGYFRTSNDREAWSLKAPGKTGIVSLYNPSNSYTISFPNKAENSAETFAMISDLAGLGGGTTYTGTASRITVTGSVIDIASTYVGQASITTLGTIGTGTWNGTNIAINKIAATGTPSATTYLRGDGTWSTVSGGTGTPAGSTGQIQFNSAGAFGADSLLFWDNTNKRLGVGTSTPLSELYITSTRLTGDPHVIFALGKTSGAVVGYRRDAIGRHCLFSFETGSSSAPDGYIGTFSNKSSAVYMTSASSSGILTTLGVDGSSGVMVGGSNSFIPSSMLHVRSNGITGRPVLILNTATTQTVDIFQAQNVSNVFLSGISSLGDFKVSSGLGIVDANNNYILKSASTVSSAVNYLTISNAATNNNPSLSLEGTDANIGFSINPKGIGYSSFNGTQAVLISRGTTAQEPGQASQATAVNGMMRYNTSTNKFRIYENGAWKDLGGDFVSKGGNVDETITGVKTFGNINVSSIRNATDTNTKIDIGNSNQIYYSISTGSPTATGSLFGHNFSVINFSGYNLTNANAVSVVKASGSFFGSSANNVTAFRGFDSELNLSEAVNTATDYYGYYLRSVTGNGFITGTAYGLYMENINKGVNRFSIYTNTGRVSFGDVMQLRVTTNSSPQDGDVWREDNTDTGLKVRINGATKTITVS